MSLPSLFCPRYVESKQLKEKLKLICSDIIDE
jgi:hypothetical protein